MRLIDADAFIEQLKADIVEMHVPEFIVAAQALTIDIAERPTIEAIPVEWITEYAEKTSYFDEVIYDMLEDWKEENGTDRQR